MIKIYNLDDIPDNFIDAPYFKSDLKTKYLGALAGSEKLYVNIDFVKPGAKSVKYHSHSLQEEFFLILEGKGKVRINNKEFTVKRGDFFAKPAGKEIAHQFINDSDEILKILDCGVNDKNDIITYPDENVIYVKKENKSFRSKDSLKNWSSDPNAEM
ncbi:MAG: cupin domain-containing protein [Candidatus Cloacimonetes bacterium]|nr:cupin domain-containing protein [Candidatus Cloacimonadota bacterium]MBL7085659.1 cupin domain-containing protein [Candidatus Cloacimonadota bacterium]